VERFRVGTTADKLAKFIFSQERNGVIDLSAYRTVLVATEDFLVGGVNGLTVTRST